MAPTCTSGLYCVALRWWWKAISPPPPHQCKRASAKQKRRIHQCWNLIWNKRARDKCCKRLYVRRTPCQHYFPLSLSCSASEQQRPCAPPRRWELYMRICGLMVMRKFPERGNEIWRAGVKCCVGLEIQTRFHNASLWCSFEFQR